MLLLLRQAMAIVECERIHTNYIVCMRNVISFTNAKVLYFIRWHTHTQSNNTKHTYELLRILTNPAILFHKFDDNYFGFYGCFRL